MSTIDDYVSSLPDPLRRIAEKVVPIVDAELPGALWMGNPTWSLGERPVCVLKAYSSYVTFAFWRGQSIDDLSGRLEPGSHKMAHVRLRTVDDVDPELFTEWVRQAKKLESDPPPA